LAKRVLVTGGAGFIGSHVCEYFLEHKWVVEVIDDFSTGKQENLGSAVTIHTTDVRSAEAAQIVQEGSFDVVVHLAAQMDVRKSVVDPIRDAGINILGTLNLAEAVRARSRKSRIVFSSTGGAVYGDFVTQPTVETVPKDPESPYAVAKLSVEYYLAYYARVHGLDTVALRYGNVYGPRQDPHGEAGVVAIFAGRILEGRPLTIYGDGKQTRDYVYVSDVAAATFLAATKPLPEVERVDARAFNVGTGVGTSVNELARILLRVSEQKVPIEYAPQRRGEQQHSFLNVQKAARVLGWTPGVSLDAGLKRSLDWFATRYRAAVRA
jgi:UDP-glucose 4-epimerase